MNNCTYNTLSQCLQDLVPQGQAWFSWYSGHITSHDWNTSQTAATRCFLATEFLLY